MAKEIEELTDGEALAIVQRLQNEYRFIGRLHGVLTRYNEANAALPGLEKRTAALERDVAAHTRTLDDLKAHHDAKVQELQAEFKKHDKYLAEQIAANKQRLKVAVAEADKLMLEKASDVARADEQAAAAIKAIGERIREAEQLAETRIQEIDRSIAEKEAQHKRMIGQLNRLAKTAAEIRSVENG